MSENIAEHNAALIWVAEKWITRKFERIPDGLDPDILAEFAEDLPQLLREESVCPDCGGRGYKHLPTPLGMARHTYDCEMCKGTGERHA